MKTRMILFIAALTYLNITETGVDKNEITTAKIKRTIANVTQPDKVLKEKKAFNEFKIRKNNLRRIRSSANKYRQQAKYPHTSQPVEHDQTEDHLKMRYAHKSANLELADSSIKLWTSKLYYEKEIDKVIIYYSISNPISIEYKSLVLKTKNKNIKLTGKKVNKNLFAAEIDSSKLDEGQYIVQLAINSKDLLTTSFAVQKPHYEFFNVSSDEISSAGDLIFQNIFNITVPGEYIIEGTLYLDNKQIAIAEKVVSLTAGTQTINLEFYGKILRELNVDSKFTLKYISLSYVKKNLASKNFGILNVDYETEHYNYDQFHNNDYNNEVMLKKAQLGASL